MDVDGTPQRTIRLAEDGRSVTIIDQTALPYAFVHHVLRDRDDAIRAIATMQVRGAPLIGVTAAYGMALAMVADPSDTALATAYELFLATRPTAINLKWALDEMLTSLRGVELSDRARVAIQRATEIADGEVDLAHSIGRHGSALLVQAWKRKQRSTALQVLTHCNAGWLATVDVGTALAPIYEAHAQGIPLHVWVDETRPRNQGARLTAWELGAHGIPHTVIVDNAGGYLMWKKEVDLCIVGADRTTSRGDVCNKIGTYLKALAAYDNGIPFYVAFPKSTIDWSLEHGHDIPIEERDPSEVRTVVGRLPAGNQVAVDLFPEGSPAKNYGFDVTPARLVTAFITERGVCAASREGLASLYPECAPHD